MRLNATQERDSFRGGLSKSHCLGTQDQMDTICEDEEGENSMMDRDRPNAMFLSQTTDLESSRRQMMILVEQHRPTEAAPNISAQAQESGNQNEETQRSKL